MHWEQGFCLLGLPGLRIVNKPGRLTVNPVRSFELFESQPGGRPRSPGCRAERRLCSTSPPALFPGPSRSPSRRRAFQEGSPQMSSQSEFGDMTMATASSTIQLTVTGRAQDLLHAFGA